MRKQVWVALVFTLISVIACTKIETIKRKTLTTNQNLEIESFPFTQTELITSGVYISGDFLRRELNLEGNEIKEARLKAIEVLLREESKEDFSALDYVKLELKSQRADSVDVSEKLVVENQRDTLFILPLDDVDLTELYLTEGFYLNFETEARGEMETDILATIRLTHEFRYVE